MMPANWSARSVRQHVWPGINNRSSGTRNPSTLLACGFGLGRRRGRALRKPVQFVGISAVHPKVSSSVLGGGDNDKRLLAAGAIGFDEKLQFSGIDEQDCVVVGQLPWLAVAGPPAADEPNVVAVVSFLAVSLLRRDATDP